MRKLKIPVKIIFFTQLFLLMVLLLFFNPSVIHADTKRPFVMPLEGEIIVAFRQVYYDREKGVERKHTGIDIAGNKGSAVLASGNGTVIYTGFSPVGGRTVVIRHNEKIRTTYLNLSQVLVSTGTYVKQGHTIATIGALDDPSSESVHLHFGIIYDGKYLDPQDVLGIDYSNITGFIKLKYIKPDFNVLP